MGISLPVGFVGWFFLLTFALHGRLPPVLMPLEMSA